jgi:hypothetical protein
VQGVDGIGALSRFAAGTAVSVGAGWLLFRAQTFRPDSAWFHCITAGALVAGVLALVRTGWPGQALALGVAYTLVQTGYAWTQGWRRAATETLASAVLAGGAVICSILFDAIDREGYRFGKFALLGPLLAGVFLASTSLGLVGLPPGDDAVVTLVRHVFVGLVIGDAVGLGVELVELLPGLRATAGDAPGA